MRIAGEIDFGERLLLALNEMFFDFDTGQALQVSKRYTVSFAGFIAIGVRECRFDPVFSWRRFAPA